MGSELKDEMTYISSDLNNKKYQIIKYQVTNLKKMT